MADKPRVVVMGGGTGSYVVASGLTTQPVEITMLMTMVDDGGSNRTIRDEFGLLPTSGIRQAIVALSKNKTLLRKLFTYRYSQGGQGLNGMTFGNLFMAAMADIMGSQKAGIEETCKLLQVEGQILPISYDDVRLVAEYENGLEVTGEHLIDEPEHDKHLRIKQLRTEPAAQLNPEAKRALLNADLIVMGPGDLYTNTIANLVVTGVVPTLQETPAPLLFVTNLMTTSSETYNYHQSDFFEDLNKYLPLEIFDYILVNNNPNYPQEVLSLYQQEQAQPITDDLKPEMINQKVKIIRTDLLSASVAEPQAGDQLKRSMIRHDAAKLTQEIMKIIK